MDSSLMKMNKRGPVPSIFQEAELVSDHEGKTGLTFGFGDFIGDVDILPVLVAGVENEGLPVPGSIHAAFEKGTTAFLLGSVVDADDGPVRQVFLMKDQTVFLSFEHGDGDLVRSSGMGDDPPGTAVRIGRKFLFAILDQGFRIAGTIRTGDIGSQERE
jgi:hypothetical protein